MNLSPVTVSSAPSPAEGPRSEPIPQGEFSSVLSQQQGRVREDGATAPRSTPTSAADERDVAAPEETLALLAAGATLPLMTASAMLAGDPGASTRGLHAGGAARSATATAATVAMDASKAILADAAASVSAAGAQLNDAADIRATGRQTLSAANRSSAPMTAELPGIHGSQAASARPHTALSPKADSAQAAARVSARMDAAQAAFIQNASDLGLNTQPVRSAAAPGINGQSIQETGNAMFGLAASSGSSTILPSTQSGTPVVATPLSSPTWGLDFSRQFISMTQGRDMSTPHTIELRLDPPSLGPVRITLQISDSIAQAAFVSPHAAVRQAIENALPALQQQLAEAGLSLGQASVNDQQASQQGFEQSSSQGSNQRAVFSLDGHAAQGPSALPPPPRQPSRSPDALVDTFA